jgi:signal recognition particle GTPase
MSESKRLFFLDGISGAGKTSTVAKIVYSLLDNKSNVVFAAPNAN